MKISHIIFALFFPIQLIGPSYANVIKPQFLAERHAKLLNSDALDSSNIIKLKATCGRNAHCVVGIDGESIITSTGIRISSDRIIGWTLTNASNSGGVLFVGKNEDYRFLIKHFDGSGKRRMSEIGFFNFKSAQSFLSSLELLSGLGANHDQAGAATKCTARGKDALSGADLASTAYLDRNTISAAGLRNTAAGALVGGATGALAGDVVGSSTAIATGALVGGIAGAVVGDSLGKSSGSLSLKRNVVSDVRSRPATSKAFLDNSFAHKKDCIDEPLNSTTVQIGTPIPLKVSD